MFFRRVLNSSLYTKTIVAFLLMTLIPVGTVTYVNYRSTQAALTESANQALFAAASHTVASLDGFINSKLDAVYSKSRLSDLTSYLLLPPQQRRNSELERRILENLFDISHSRGFDQFYMSSYALLDADGRNVLDSLPEQIGRDESSRPYFQIAMNMEGPYVSAIEFPDQRSVVSLYFSCPVRHHGGGLQVLGDIVGVVRLRYSAAIFQQILSQSAGLAGKKSFAMLFDDNGMLIANSAAPELLFKFVIPPAPDHLAELQQARRLPNLPTADLMLDLPEFRQGLQKSEHQPFFAAQTHPDVDQREQIAVVKMERQPWLVAFGQPREEFLAPVKAQARVTLGLTTIIAVIVIAFAIGLAHLLTKPIVRLTFVAEQISAGDLSTEVCFETTDEIGKLGKTFNIMTDRLRHTLDDLKRHRDNLEVLVEERTRDLKQEIAERKRAEEAANAANQAKSSFLAAMSHELRTPLNAILGYAHILKRGKSPTENEHKHLEIIERSGTLLLNLINELLDLSRIEAQKFELHEEVFSLYRCLKSVISMIEIRSKEKGICFDSVLDSSLPSSVIGDEHRLSQILLNLLGNAVKFTDRGEVTLKVVRKQNAENGRLKNRLEKESQPTDCQLLTTYLSFEVSDTGPGIPEHRLEEIFSPFAQVGDHTRKRKGTGLGLAISRQFVQLMGGRLNVESKEGQGSCFWFEIPLALPEHTEQVSKHVSAEPHIIGYKGEQKSLLIVDDNVQNRSMLVSLLSPLGFAVQEAVDGQDALKSLESSALPPDLVLLDLIMPVMNGFEFIRHLRNSAKFKDIKIVVTSANVSLLTEKDRARRNSDDFLAKPIHIDMLLNCLAKHLSLAWVYEQTPDSTAHGGPLIFPPQEDQEALLRAAQGGYITDIRDINERLNASDAAFEPFTAKIDDMLKDFQFRQILEFITSATNE